MSNSSPSDKYTVIEDRNGNPFSSEPGISQALLQKGMKVTVNIDGKPHYCRVADWYYEAGTYQTPPKLHVVVDVLKPVFDNLTPETQKVVLVIMYCFALLVVGGIAYAVYLEATAPTLFWGFIGYYVRTTVFVAILLADVVLVGTTKGFLDHKTLRGHALAAIYTALTVAMIVGWIYITTPQKELKIYPDDYADYVYYLGQQFKQNLILPLISVSWLAGVFKIIGWTIPEVLMGLIPDIFKKKEE